MRTRRWQRLCVMATLSVAAAAAAPARADDRTGAAAPELVAPRLLDAPPVRYPPSGSGDANVALALSIDKEGKVSHVEILTGDEPFAAAALAAAAAFRYEPARRGDVRVASRIRVLVEFHAPAPVAPADTPPAPPVREGGSAKIDQVTEEVTVQGQRAEIARTNLGAADIRQMPGAFGDAFRAIDALPGVTPIVSGLPYYFIRGAPPGNTGYLIDGVRVPLLFHFGVARAVIHPGLVDHVDFYPGGFPARYGRYAGAIIDGQTKAPEGRLHGEWDASVLHAGGLVEAPFGDGRGYATVAGRYGYPGLLLSVLAPGVFLQYGDYQARVGWRLGTKDTVSAFIFGSYDGAGAIKNGKLQDLTTTQFHRVDARWDHDLEGGGHVRTALTLGVDRSGTGDRARVSDWLQGLRTTADVPLSRAVRVRAGADVMLDQFSISADAGDATAQTFPTRKDLAGGVWMDAVLKPAEGVEIVPGARVDYFASKSTLAGESGAVPTFDPRLATRVRLAPRVAWLTASGISHQPPAFLVPVPGLQLGALKQGVQTAVQTSQGIELLLPLDVTLTPTAFLHNYLRLTDATATCGFGRVGDTGSSDDCLDQRVRGRTFGLELLVRRPLTKRLTGWIAYTLSRSTREAHPLGGKGAVSTIPSEFDRPHVLNVIGAYDLGRNWRIGARFLYYTGRPYSNSIQSVPVPPFNSVRLPSFFRFDARLEKRWRTKTGYVAFVAEALNLTANKEVLDVRCTPAALPTAALDKCEPDTSGAIPVIVPVVGFEGAF